MELEKRADSHGYSHEHRDEDHHHHHHDHQHPEGDHDGYWRGKDGKLYHSHDGLAPHTHEPLESPGYFLRRAPPLGNRDFVERAFTVGIGGPVGSGKTALMLALCHALREKYSIAAVINKTDLADAVGADLKVMERDATRMRDRGPFIFAQVKNGVGMDQIVAHILEAWKQATRGELR